MTTLAPLAGATRHDRTAAVTGRTRGSWRTSPGRALRLIFLWGDLVAVLAATLIIIGIQAFFTSFLISILGLRRRDQSPRDFPV